MLELLFLLSVSLVVYTYAGYPLLAAILGRLFGREPGAHSHTPPVTLLIAAYNEEDVIAERLENALSLDYPRDKLQILVAADGSDDGTAAIVESFAARGVELSYDLARRGKMAAINRAMPRATGEIVVFSDANNMYEAEAIRRLVRPFANPQVGAAGGAKRIVKGDGALGESEGLYWHYEDFIKREESRLGTTTGVCGEILALRRNLFRAPPSTTVNDDFYMALDLIARGYDVLYVGDACSYERVSPSAESERARRARIVAGRYQAMFTPPLWPRRPLPAWQVISHKYLRPLVPLAMLLALASNIMALLHAPVSREKGRLLAGRSGWLLLGGQLVFYLTAWLGQRFEDARGPVKLLYLPAFLVSANLAALDGLVRFLRGQQSTLWQRVPRRSNELPGNDGRNA